MNIASSPTVAIGPIFPSGNIENGKLFLKIDGIADGLFIFYNNQWLRIGKIASETGLPFAPTVTGSNVSEFSNTDLSILIGGNY